ncbi:hypothetical protein PV10_06318 [Exophiala mesophila]|uniref:Uncharacterized protein n=1 Tax=Exophiala mesophila TaxID=212818 RepID=A0A0D1XUE6_EXOME|nr:uncharacterized protein PV10_06318 [Exophiala mesophila]KIV91821.1 hypothetical protein PV10_06318 [Exophiala mesophila]
MAATRRETRSAEVLKLHREHGDFVRLAFNHISVDSPDALDAIYSHKARFAKGPYYDAFMQGPLNVFNTRDFRQHSKRKRILQPAFSESSLARFEPEMDRILMQWKRELTRRATADGVQLNIALWVTLLAFDSIGSFSFGLPGGFGFCERGVDHLNLGHAISSRASIFNALGTVPGWMRPLMAYLPFDNYYRSLGPIKFKLSGFAQDALKQRSMNDGDKRDVVSFLSGSKDPETGQTVPDDIVLTEATGFIAAGSHSTAVTMTLLLDTVARDVKVRRRLQAELDAAFPGKLPEDWIPSRRLASELPYFMATIRESQRVFPTSSTGLERVIPEGGRTICGEYLPEGTLVSSPLNCALKDPRVFSDPDRFDPERWLGANSKDLLAHFHPFSLGPRVCLGRAFAMFEMVKTLALFIRLFEFENASPEPTPYTEGFFVNVEDCEVLIRLRE